MIAQIQYRKRGAVAAVWANIPGEALVSTLAGTLGGVLVAAGERGWGGVACGLAAAGLVECGVRLLREREALMAAILHMSASVGPQNEVQIEEQK